MFLTLGAWAQTSVLTYVDITAPQELSAVDATTIREMGGMTIVADVEITNSSNVSLLFAAVADCTSSSTENNTIWGLGTGGNAMRYIVGARDGGWYSTANGTLTISAKKIIYTYDGTTIKRYVDGIMVGAGQNSTKSLSTFNGENAKFYLGGVIYNKNTQWGTFNGTISKVEIYNSVLSDLEIAEMCYSKEVVLTPEEFENGKIYTFQTSLGWMGARESDTNAISTAKTSNNTTGSAEDPYFQWTVYKSEKENYYIYNVGKGMFLGEQSTTGNASVPMSATPAKVTFKVTEKGGYPLMFKTTDDVNCVVNHSKSYGAGLITWNNGWSQTTNDGNSHLITLVGDLDNSVLTTIKNEVDAFEADNTLAVEELDAAIASAEEWLNTYVGIGVGKYSATDADYATKLEEIRAFRNAIVAINTPTPAEVKAKTDEVEELIASFQLNLPETGKFYRLKGISGNYIDASSIHNSANATTGQMSMKSAEDCNLAGTIFYFDAENHLLSYATGTYVKETSEIGAVNNDKGVWTITESPRDNGTYALSCTTTGGRGANLHDNSGSYADRCSSNCGDRHDFTIEEVSSLPVTIGTVGYATLHAPVALTVSAGVTAYTGALNDANNILTLTAINAGATIPANTAVILEGAANTYDFAVATDAAAIEDNDLVGTVETEVKSGTVYTLQSHDTYGVAFKQYIGTNLTGFKAYLAIENAQAQAIRIRKGSEEDTTGIENSELNVENSAIIYDLQGRRVEKMEKGIYIVNGKKIIK